MPAQVTRRTRQVVMWREAQPAPAAPPSTSPPAASSSSPAPASPPSSMPPPTPAAAAPAAGGSSAPEPLLGAKPMLVTNVNSYLSCSNFFNVYLICTHHRAYAHART